MKTPKKPVPLMPTEKSPSLMPNAKTPMNAAFDLAPKPKTPAAKPVKAPKAPKVAKAPAKPFKNPLAKKGKK